MRTFTRTALGAALALAWAFPGAAQVPVTATGPIPAAAPTANGNARPTTPAVIINANGDPCNFESGGNCAGSGGGSGSGGGGGGAVTAASGSYAAGAIVDLGTGATPGVNTSNGLLQAIKAALAGSLTVNGTFWQSIQPVSAASLPLPAGAATAANQPPLNADGGAPAHVTNFPPTQPVSVSGTVAHTPAAAVATTSAQACEVLKSSAGTLYSASGYIASAGWVLVLNAASAPSNGAVTPSNVIYAGAAGSWSISFTATPQTMSTGVTICESSTGPYALTQLSTSAFITGQVQ